MKLSEFSVPQSSASTAVTTLTALTTQQLANISCECTDPDVHSNDLNTSVSIWRDWADVSVGAQRSQFYLKRRPKHADFILTSLRFYSGWTVPLIGLYTCFCLHHVGCRSVRNRNDVWLTELINLTLGSADESLWWSSDTRLRCESFTDYTRSKRKSVI